MKLVKLWKLVKLSLTAVTGLPGGFYLPFRAFFPQLAPRLQNFSGLQGDLPLHRLWSHPSKERGRNQAPCRISSEKAKKCYPPNFYSPRFESSLDG